MICPACETVYLSNQITQCETCGSKIELIDEERDYTFKVFNDVELSKISKNEKDFVTNNTNLLKKLGFTPNQSQIYIFLSKFGKNSGMTIHDNLKIPRTEVYNLLRLLIEKGFVVRHRTIPSTFEAIPISAILEKVIINSKKTIKELEKIQYEINNKKSNKDHVFNF